MLHCNGCIDKVVVLVVGVAAFCWIGTGKDEAGRIFDPSVDSRTVFIDVLYGFFFCDDDKSPALFVDPAWRESCVV